MAIRGNEWRLAFARSMPSGEPPPDAGGTRAPEGQTSAAARILAHLPAEEDAVFVDGAHVMKVARSENGLACERILRILQP